MNIFVSDPRERQPRWSRRPPSSPRRARCSVPGDVPSSGTDFAGSLPLLWAGSDLPRVPGKPKRAASSPRVRPRAPRALYPLLPFTGRWLLRGERIRVTEHPLEIHLLFAVRTRLLLPDDAPATDAELVKPGERHVKGELPRAGGGDNTRPSVEETTELKKVTPTPLRGGPGNTHAVHGRPRCTTAALS